MNIPRRYRLLWLLTRIHRIEKCIILLADLPFSAYCLGITKLKAFLRDGSLNPRKYLGLGKISKSKRNESLTLAVDADPPHRKSYHPLHRPPLLPILPLDPWAEQPVQPRTVEDQSVRGATKTVFGCGSFKDCMGGGSRCRIFMNCLR